jgi:hypothetical protein
MLLRKKEEGSSTSPNKGTLNEMADRMKTKNAFVCHYAFHHPQLV